MTFKWIDPTSEFTTFIQETNLHNHSVAALYHEKDLVAAGYGAISHRNSALEVSHPQFSNKEAYSLFLKQIEQKTQASGCLSASIFFYSDRKDVKQLKSALKECGWSEPEEWMINCHFDHSFNPPWFDREIKPPPPYTLLPWSALSEQQIAQLRYKGEQYVYPPNLSPFLYPNPEPTYSLCLLHEKEVIGWMMTRMVNDQTISFDSFFIEHKYRKTTLLLALLIRSIKFILSSPIPFATMQVNLKQTDSSYINFVLKRYVPYINDYNYTLRSWKLINS